MSFYLINQASKYLIFSELCDAGNYKSGDMVTCEKCPDGKVANNDKTQCGTSPY